MFSAILIEKDDNGSTPSRARTSTKRQLPDGDVSIDVEGTRR